MNFALKWYQRFRQLLHEMTKFGVVGAVGLAITNGGYYVMHTRLDIGPVTSTTIATILATVFTYVGNRYWSFQHRQRSGVAREGMVFLVLNGIGLAIQSGTVGFNAYVLGFQHGHKVEQFVALNLGIAVATLFRFWSYRKWVWAAPAPGGPVDGASQGSPAPAPPGVPAADQSQPTPVQASRSPVWRPGPADGQGHPVIGRVSQGDQARAHNGWDHSRPAQAGAGGPYLREANPQPGRAGLDG